MKHSPELGFAVDPEGPNFMAGYKKIMGEFNSAIRLGDVKGVELAREKMKSFLVELEEDLRQSEWKDLSEEVKDLIADAEFDEHIGLTPDLEVRVMIHWRL